MSESVGIAVVGIGGYGRSHLESIAACRELGLAELKAVTVRPEDSEPEKEAELESEGAVIYRDFAEMLAGEADRCSIVAIPAGIPAHRPLSIAALEAGYDVICEKPVAGAVQDAEAMLAARNAANRILAIGYQYIYSRTVQMLKTARVERRWGRLLRAKGVALWPRTAAYYARNEWAGSMESGGARVYDSPAQNAVSHFLQLMLYVSGETPESAGKPVRLYGENYRVKPIESADTQFIRTTTDTGVDIEFWCSHSVMRNHPVRLSFFFESAEVVFTRGDAGNEFMLIHDGVARRFGEQESDTQIRRRVFEDTIDAVSTRRAPLSSIDNAIGHTRLIETLFERAAPVVPVDEPYRLSLGETDRDDPASGEGPAGEHIVIKGLDEVAIDCFERGVGFSEVNAPWALPGRTVELEQ